MKWYACTTDFPKHREKGHTELSKIVLIYDPEADQHSIGFYDYIRGEWKDITVNAYISDMTGLWTELPRPNKLLRELKMRQ